MKQRLRIGALLCSIVIPMAAVALAPPAQGEDPIIGPPKPLNLDPPMRLVG